MENNDSNKLNNISANALAGYCYRRTGFLDEYLGLLSEKDIVQLA